MFRKIVTGIVLVLVAAIGGFFVYFGLILPAEMPVPDLRVASSPEAIARGQYLARHVAVCMDCHSTRDWSYFAGPIKPGTLGRGGERFDAKSGLPGVVISKNITPYALGKWSDGEIARAMAGGISRDGHALFPLMPYDGYRFMDEADAHSVIAYLRTLQPLENDVPRHQLNFPLNLIVNAIPKPPAFRQIDRSNRVEYGRYLATLGGCVWCHTPVNDQGRTIPEMALAGGHAFPMNGGTVRSANISPDPETGIGKWSRETFIARFGAYRGPDAEALPLGANGFNTLMSWTQFAGMTDEDLGAIYEFVMQSRPIGNPVTVWEAAAASSGT
jgi:mono/diheme cytochrome c family protein